MAKVDVVKYNPDWKNLYSSEAERIKKACGDKILIIEHAGSTSVEGLAAKPTIDIYIGTKTLLDAHNMINAMTNLGYEYVTKYEKELPFRRYFVKRNEDWSGSEDLYHVHVTPAAHPFRRDDLLFRDYIVYNSNSRKDYESLKLKLSETDWEQRMDYNIAKDELCQKIKKEAQKFFGDLFEQTESEATYLMHKYASNRAMEKAKFTILRNGELTAIRTDIFPGFSLNRALGITRIDNEFLDQIDDFYEGRAGKFALQIPPNILNDEKLALLKSRGYSYANSWVTFCRDSSTVESKGTDLVIKEIGKEYASEFAYTLDEVFSFPHEFDGIAASSIGEKECITFMAFDGQNIAGSGGIYIMGETAYLSFANVKPEYRRRGVQGELLKRRIDTARGRGVKWIFVDTAENSEEHPNPSYWNMLRHGFHLMYHRPNYVKVQ